MIKPAENKRKPLATPPASGEKSKFNTYRYVPIENRYIFEAGESEGREVELLRFTFV